MGLFEKREETLEKIVKGAVVVDERRISTSDEVPKFIFQILNNNSPTINTNVRTEINVDIDIDLQVVNNAVSNLKGDSDYLLEALGNSDKDLRDALKKLMQFADDSKNAKNSNDVREKGWGRKLKSIIQTLSKSGEQLKNIQDGSDTLKSIYNELMELATQFNFQEVGELIKSLMN